MTIYIQFLGTPCVGKSTIAHSLYSCLALKKYHVEYVPEYAKQLVYKGELKYAAQLEISQEQYQKLVRLKDKVQVVITDTHILNGLVYKEEWKEYQSVLMAYQKNLAGITVDVTANIKYQEDGRIQRSGELAVIRERIEKIIKRGLIPKEDLIIWQNCSCSSYEQFCKDVDLLGFQILQRIGSIL